MLITYYSIKKRYLIYNSIIYRVRYVFKKLFFNSEFISFKIWIHRYIKYKVKVRKLMRPSKIIVIDRIGKCNMSSLIKCFWSQL